VTKSLTLSIIRRSASIADSPGTRRFFRCQRCPPCCRGGGAAPARAGHRNMVRTVFNTANKRQWTAQLSSFTVADRIAQKFGFICRLAGFSAGLIRVVLIDRQVRDIQREATRRRPRQSRGGGEGGEKPLGDVFIAADGPFLTTGFGCWGSTFAWRWAIFPRWRGRSEIIAKRSAGLAFVVIAPLTSYGRSHGPSFGRDADFGPRWYGRVVIGQPTATPFGHQRGSRAVLATVFRVRLPFQGISQMEKGGGLLRPEDPAASMRRQRGPMMAIRDEQLPANGNPVCKTISPGPSTCSPGPRRPNRDWAASWRGLKAKGGIQLRCGVVDGGHMLPVTSPCLGTIGEWGSRPTCSRTFSDHCFPVAHGVRRARRMLPRFLRFKTRGRSNMLRLHPVDLPDDDMKPDTELTRGPAASKTRPSGLLRWRRQKYFHNRKGVLSRGVWEEKDKKSRMAAGFLNTPGAFLFEFPAASRKTSLH